MNTLTILSFALTAAFGVLSVIFFFHGRRYKRLTFVFQIAELQTKTHPAVKILFQDRGIENLSRLRGVVWNSGNEEIRSADIPRINPPTLIFPNAAVLSVSHLGVSNDNVFVVDQLTEEALSLSFAYLNPGDCGLVEVLFENKSAEKVPVELSARIIGGRKSESRVFEPPTKPSEWLGLSAGFVVLSAFVAPTTWFLWLTYNYLANFPFSSKAVILFLLLAVVGFWVFSTIRFTNLIVNNRRSNLPRPAIDFLAGCSNLGLGTAGSVAKSAKSSLS